MQITVNNNQEVTAYALIGGLAGGVEVAEAALPADFSSVFAPSYYLFQNGAFTVNPNYVAPAAVTINDTPSDVQQAINQLGLQVAALTAKIEGSDANA